MSDRVTRSQEKQAGPSGPPAKKGRGRPKTKTVVNPATVNSSGSENSPPKNADVRSQPLAGPSAPPPAKPPPPALPANVASASVPTPKPPGPVVSVVVVDEAADSRQNVGASMSSSRVSLDSGLLERLLSKVNRLSSWVLEEDLSAPELLQQYWRKQGEFSQQPTAPTITLAPKLSPVPVVPEAAVPPPATALPASGPAVVVDGAPPSTPRPVQKRPTKKTKKAKKQAKKKKRAGTPQARSPHMAKPSTKPAAPEQPQIAVRSQRPSRKPARYSDGLHTG